MTSINKYIIWLMYFVIFSYNMLDIYQTKLLLDLGAYEVNPLLGYLMDITGSWTVVVFFKLFFLMGLGILLIIQQRNN